MARSGTLALLVALVLFSLFFGNVALGAFGDGPVLGDVSEVLLMFAASLFFTIGVLQREAKAPKENTWEDTT